MRYKNATYNAHGTIDVEIEHPLYGWIPFTASIDDPEEFGRNVYVEVLHNSPIMPYSEPVTRVQTLLEEQMTLTCDARQLIDALGEERWKMVVTYGSDLDTPWHILSALFYTTQWKRLSPETDILAYALKATPSEMDELFRLARTL